MIRKKDLKLFGVVFLINLVTLFLEILFFGVKLSKFSLMLLFLFAVVETLLIDKIALKEEGVF